MTSFSRTNVSVPPAAVGWAAGAIVGLAAGGEVGLAGWPPPAPPQATMRLIAPALNRLDRNSRRVAIVPSHTSIAALRQGRGLSVRLARPFVKVTFFQKSTFERDPRSLQSARAPLVASPGRPSGCSLRSRSAYPSWRRLRAAGLERSQGTCSVVGRPSHHARLGCSWR